MKLANMFAGCKGTAFMPYVCCGDPTGRFTIKLAQALAANGADAIEIGIPFSDPIADGKTIQAASQRAIAGGMTPKKAIGMVSKLRRMGLRLPIVVMTYYNIICAHGEQAFIARIKKAGVDGLIVPDVPLEESEALRRICRKSGIDLVFLVTSNCSSERLRRIASKASGFLYAVSVLGTTGARKKVDSGALALVRRAKRLTHLPVVVGFGISKPAHASAFEAAGANGVIVGSEIINTYSKFMEVRRIDGRRALDAVARYAAEMKNSSEKYRSQR